MKNYIQEGKSLDYVPAVDVLGGDFVTEGSIVGVVVADTLTGELGAISTEGVFELPKATATVFAYGDPVMVPAAASSRNVDVIADAGTGVSVGVVVQAAGSGPLVVRVKLVG